MSDLPPCPDQPASAWQHRTNILPPADISSSSASVQTNFITGRLDLYKYLEFFIKRNILHCRMSPGRAQCTTLQDGPYGGPSLWLKVLTDKYHTNVWVIVMMIIIIAILGILKIVKILIILLKLRAFDHYIEKNIFHSWGRSLNVGICCLDLLVNPYNNE